jgi:DNA-binding protein Fis
LKFFGFRLASRVLVPALQRTDNNVSKPARLLGVHRTRLRRLLAHHNLREA